MKKCYICKKEKAKENFYKNKSNKDGLHSYCKECAIAKSSQWDKDNAEKKYNYNKQRREENPEYFKWYRDNYYNNNREKVLEDYRKWTRENKDKLKDYRLAREQNKTHDISESEWRDCKEYFEYKCAYCGISEDEHKNYYNQQLHREHVAHDGANDLSNCVPSCKSCNSSKWTFSLSEWYVDTNPLYDQERLLKINKWLDGDFSKYIETT